MAGGTVGERITAREELTRRACSLAMKAHWSSAGKPYICEKARSSSSEVIFAFSGSWESGEWFAHKPFGETKIKAELFPSLKTIGSNQAAGVNEAFLRRFEAVLANSSLTNEVEKAAAEKKQTVFTGHSSAAPIAIFAALWLLEKQRHTCGIPPDCITFGSPLVGDWIFAHALKRECWSQYFTHFITRYDIVPRIFLSPLSTMERELQPTLHYFNPKSPLYTSDYIAKTTEASIFVINVMRNASAVTSHAACKLMGSTNLILETVTKFVELSPYRPSGTYVFCTGSGKLVILENPDAIFQVLFYCLQLASESEWAELPQRSLKDHLIYESALLETMGTKNVACLDNLEDLPLSAEDNGYDQNLAITTALNDLGLSTRARLTLRAAGELEKQRARNQSKVNSNRRKIEDLLRLLERYRANCEVQKVGYYDAFKIQKHIEDFNNNIRRLELAGIWDEMMEMLKRNELPDEFEKQKEWIELGTRYRRLVEPLDIANYYRHLKNEDTGSYIGKGRPTRYKFTQKWLEHAGKIVAEPVPESCFWAEVEELCISTCNKEENFEAVKSRVQELERNLSRWARSGLLGKDVFLNESTFVQWWKKLPMQHRSTSCIKDLLNA